MLFTLCACSTDKISGTYVCTERNETIEFFKDGTLGWSDGWYYFDGTYSKIDNGYRVIISVANVKRMYTMIKEGDDFYCPDLGSGHYFIKQ